MYSSTPPRPGEPHEPSGGWGLQRAIRLAFPEPAVHGRDAKRVAQLGTYFTDMLRPHGLGLDPGVLERGGQSYGEMAEALIDATVPEGEQVDLLVLAYSIPDFTPGRATTTYLSHICPGRPMAFAVSDQGTAAAFTGLRLIREYAGAGDLRRALLLVVEQAALPYDPGVPVTVPTGNFGVALLFSDQSDEIEPPGRTPRPVSATVEPGCPDATLADAISTLTTPPDRTTAILGAGLAAQYCPSADLKQVRLASPGRPCTGVWWELAGLPAEPGPSPERLILADYEPRSRYLCISEFDTSLAAIDESTVRRGALTGDPAGSRR